MANKRVDLPELSATQQADYDSRFGLDKDPRARLTLNGVELVQDEYFEDSPAMYRPDPPEDFSPEFKKEINKTLELIKALTKDVKNG